MFQLAYPWLLLLIALPWVILLVFPRVIPPKLTAAQLPIADQLSAFQTQGRTSAFKPNISFVGAFILWALLIVALAGPQWLGPPIRNSRLGRNIMLAIDLSGSMATQDMKWQGSMHTRLSVVKAVATQFIDHRQNDRIGLILFGSQAYLQTPLTFDHTTVKQMLDDATIGLAGQQTAIGDAVGLAIKRLVHTPSGSRILILLTDGMNNAGNALPLDAAKMAKREGIRIYTIGLTGGKVVVNTPLGPQVVDTSGDLDPTTLQKIASLTGGLFFKAQDGAALTHVFRSLDQIEKTTGKQHYHRQIKRWYYIPLALAFILSLVWALVVCLRSFWLRRTA